MITVVFILIAVFDLVLLGLFFALNRKQVEQSRVISELSDERGLLEDLRQSVQQELEIAYGKAKEVVAKITLLASEAEQEVKAGQEQLVVDVESLRVKLAAELEQMQQSLAKKQLGLETSFKHLDREKLLVQKLISRGEKLCAFFDKRIPYQEVLEEIEDKKYVDARTLLSQGRRAEDVAQELGMSVAEVRLIAGIGMG